jgi:ArsR family transcriptional regulator
MGGYGVGMKPLAQIFKALSDETRLRILALLTRGELCVCNLVAVLQLPQSTVSRHLAYLRNTDLIADRREGVWMYYRLEDRLPIMQGQAWQSLLEQLLTQQQAETDRADLKQYLARKEESRCG